MTRILKMPTLRKPRAVWNALWAASELGTRDLRRILVRVSPRRAEQAVREVRRGTRPLLGTLVALLSEIDAPANSDAAFIARAYEKLLLRRPSEEELSRHEQALTSAFLSRAEVVQDLITSAEFERLLERKARRPDIELANLTSSEALFIDRVQTVLRPSRLLPPVTMRWKVGQFPWDVYGHYFEIIGRHFQAKLVRDGGLRAASRVLDVGSGCGRITMPLTEIIGPSGLYIGLETVAPMVRWCQHNISARFPQFRFIHCGVQNSAYNPDGAERAEQYKFPFDAEQFDLVIATSVFTHLRPASAQNYIFQCARVLKPGGKLFATAFLIENGPRSANCPFKFEHSLDAVAFTTEPSAPEAAVAYPVEWLLENLRRTKLELAQPIRWGSWSGREPAYSGQDVLILEKKN